MTFYTTDNEFLRSFTRYNALSSPRYAWHTTVTEKETSCEFGCDIPAEQLYFKKPLDAYGERAVHLCWDCMKKVVYLTIDTDKHAKDLTSHLMLHARFHEPDHAILD